jgi:pyridoxamine 5'-phosphate oxidase
VQHDPITRFQETFERAKIASAFDPTACALATAESTGRPSVRMVLLKGADERGFVFYTNQTSRKADELADNPWAALCFFWPHLAEQVRVEGLVEKTSGEESDAYFRTRPRESQIGAWASRQSRPTPSHEILHERFHEIAQKYAGQDVPRPRWWGGYRVIPDRIEFWKSMEHRLHLREEYKKDPETGLWSMQILDP